MTLSDREMAFLKDLWSRERPVLIKSPTHPMVAGLATRGWVTLHRARSGPLGVFTGEEMVDLSEAGVKAIEAMP
jgi:hypothetical protein